jgi:hypothetical protein
MFLPKEGKGFNSPSTALFVFVITLYDERFFSVLVAELNLCFYQCGGDKNSLGVF